MLPAWLYHSLNELEQSDYAEIKLIIGSDAETPKTSFFSRLNHLCYRLFLKFEKRIFKLDPNAFALVDCKKLFAKKTSFGFDEFESIKKEELDILLCLDSGVASLPLVACAKFGVWGFGTQEYEQAAQAFFKNKSSFFSKLQMWQEGKEQVMLVAQTYSSTEDISLNRNLNKHYWKVAGFIPNALKQLHHLGEDAFFQNKQEVKVSPLQLLGQPSNVVVLAGVFSKYWQKLKQKITNRFYFEQWILLFQVNQDGKTPFDFKDYKRILPPKDRFWADPFGMERNGQYYIFFEELPFSTNKGHISVMQVFEDGTQSTSEIILEKPYHLSYPFLFEEDGELYMLPETSENSTIELYKCIEFPKKWELEKVLMNEICAVDSTIWKKDGKYCLFTNVRMLEGASKHDELHLYYADSLLADEWRPHPQNPIVSDVRSARPAGKIFEKEGKWYRPSQDCSVRYGYGMQIAEIISLEEDKYKERIIEYIEPNWSKDLLATHSFNQENRFSVIDALIQRKK